MCACVLEREEGERAGACWVGCGGGVYPPQTTPPTHTTPTHSPIHAHATPPQGHVGLCPTPTTTTPPPAAPPAHPPERHVGLCLSHQPLFNFVCSQLAAYTSTAFTLLLPFSIRTQAKPHKHTHHHPPTTHKHPHPHPQPHLSDTLVSASAASRSPILVPVSWLPSRPASGEVLGENTMDRVGGSIAPGGRAAATLGAATVSAMPAAAAPGRGRERRGVHVCVCVCV